MRRTDSTGVFPYQERVTVTSPATVRRGGVPGVTVGNVAIGASAAALLATGPRLLGHEAFVGLALTWTMTTVFGYGLAMPTEQLLSRRLNARDAHGGSGPMRWLALLAAVSVVLIVVLGSRSFATQSDPYLALAAMTGIFGWTVAAGARGRIAGAGDLRTYTWLLFVEAISRTVMVALAVAHQAWALPLLATSVGLPILVAGVAGLPVALRHPSRARSAPGADGPAAASFAHQVEQVAFILVAVGYQVCLNGPPIVLEARVSSEATASVGAFVVANSYYRLASVLGVSYATYALASLSHAWGHDDLVGFRSVLRRALGGAAAVSALATAMAAAASPVLLPLFYGHDPEVSGGVLASLAVSTVLATVAAVATTALMAVGTGVRAAMWWLLGAAVLVVLVCLDGDMGPLTVLGLTAGPAVVLGGVLSECVRLVRSWAPRPALPQRNAASEATALTDA